MVAGGTLERRFDSERLQVPVRYPRSSTRNPAAHRDHPLHVPLPSARPAASDKGILRHLNGCGTGGCQIVAQASIRVNSDGTVPNSSRKGLSEFWLWRTFGGDRACHWLALLARLIRVVYA